MSQAASLVPAFGNWADLYLRFRPFYPPAVFDRLSALLGVRTGLCVELGAGSGQATAELAARFDRVVAVEPDPAMARLIAPAPNLEIARVRAEDFTAPRRSVDAIVVATALHWMDTSVLLPRSARWLARGGVFFAFATGKVQYPDAPRAVHERLHAEITRARVHMDGRISSWTPYEVALRASGAFAAVAAFEVYADFVWTPAEVAGFTATTSFGQALARSTGDVDAYIHQLRTDLAKASGGHPIRVRFPIEGAYGRVGGMTS
jgi:SAM-dependent methyltransferase